MEKLKWKCVNKLKRISLIFYIMSILNSRISIPGYQQSMQNQIPFQTQKQSNDLKEDIPKTLQIHEQKLNILYNYTVSKKSENSELLTRISGLEKSVNELNELKDETETIVKWLLDVSEKLKLHENNTISINTQLTEMSKKMEEMQSQMQDRIQAQDQRIHLYEQLQDQMQDRMQAQDQRIHLYEQLQDQMQTQQDQMQTQQDQMQVRQDQAEQDQAEQNQAEQNQAEQQEENI